MGNSDIRQAHYNAHGVHEVGKCLEAWSAHRFTYLWTAIVYLARIPHKSDEEALKDLRKARFYIDQEINFRQNYGWGSDPDGD